MDTEFNPTPQPAPGDAPITAPAADADPRSAQLAQAQHDYQSLVGEFQSFKRRSRQESDARAAAQKDAFILELLPAIDNLERALSADRSPGSPQFRQGVEMTLEQLRLLLRRDGVESDEPVGRLFDPHRHEAVAQRRDASQADHVVLHVFQRGYHRGANLLRPAKVVVNTLSYTP